MMSRSRKLASDTSTTTPCCKPEIPRILSSISTGFFTKFKVGPKLTTEGHSRLYNVYPWLEMMKTFLIANNATLN